MEALSGVARGICGIGQEDSGSTGCGDDFAFVKAANRQLQALLMMCAAAAVVSLAGVVRWMELHRAEGEVLENRTVRVVVVESEQELEALSAPASAGLEVARPEHDASVGAGIAGALEVLVRLGGEPLSDAAAELLDITGDIDVRGRTDRDGLARLSVRSDGWHTLRVVAPDGSKAVREWDSASAPRVEFDFGSASLAGQAFDCDGRPWAHAALHVLQPCGDSVVRRELRADGLGRFSCEGLVAGPVTLAEALAQPGASEARSATTELGEGESARLDLGVADATVAWRGLVRLRSGRVLDEELELLAVEGRRGWVERLRSDALGRIEAQLRSGDWSVQALAIDGSVEVGRLELRAEDVEQDVTLPGACVRVSLQLPSSALAEPDARAVLSIERSEEADLCQITPRDGRVLVCGLRPGNWRLAAHRSGLEPDDWHEVVVEEWDELLEPTLEVLWGVPEEP